MLFSIAVFPLILAKHADLTGSYKDRQHEPLPNSIAHIQVNLLLILKIQGGAATVSVQNLDCPNSATKRDIDVKFS